MNMTTGTKALLLITVILSSLIMCTPRLHVPAKPINITVSTVCKDSNILAALIRDGNYARLYQEVFSDSLKQRIPLSQFQGQMESFISDYGPLRPVYSEMQSCQQVGQTHYRISYVLQYKTRTIYTEFLFMEQGTGEDPPVKLVEYRFVDE